MQINTSKIKTIKEPYPLWVLDNVLPINLVNDIKAEWPDRGSNLWHGGFKEINGKKNILEQGMIAISDLDKMPDKIVEVLRSFHTREFADQIEKITKIKGLLIDESLRWSGIRTMLPNAFQLIHSDARKHPENGLRKELTLLYYLNKEDYNKETDAGCLEIWDDDMQNKVLEIEPINNRLLIFLNSSTSYHGVPIVKSQRNTITFSLLKEGNSCDRSKALFVSRPQDDEEVSILGEQRGFLKDQGKPKPLEEYQQNA
jgi:hypothetical protein